jgi:S1-C subfamily serine protease
VRAGDILVSVNDSQVPGVAAHLTMDSLRPGTRVRLGLMRDGTVTHVTVTATARP